MAGTNRATKEETEERINFACEELAKDCRHWKVKKAICEKFGIKWRQADIYIRKAKDRYIETTKKDPDELRAEVLAVLDGIIANPNAEDYSKLKALSQKADILGLNKPRKHEITGSIGPAVKIYEGINMDEV